MCLAGLWARSSVRSGELSALCTCQEVAKPGTGLMCTVVTMTDPLASWGKQFTSSEEAIDFSASYFHTECQSWTP